MKLALLRTLHFLVGHVATFLTATIIVVLVAFLTAGVRCGDCKESALLGLFLSSLFPVILVSLPVIGIVLVIQHQEDILRFIKEKYYKELNRVQEEQLRKKEKLAKKDNFELEADEEVKQLMGTSV